MAQVTMSVHEGLAKLKMYDQKIGQMLNHVPPMLGLIRNKDTIINGVSKEQYKETASAFLDSFDATLANRDILKSAIVTSNAITKVQICGVEYTVAQIIERKNSLRHAKNLVDNLLVQQKYVINSATASKENMQTSFERFLSGLGGNNKYKTEEIESLRKSYEEANGCTIYDPINVANQISVRTEKYSEFMLEVDFRLSESNALTKITVDFVD